MKILTLLVLSSLLAPAFVALPRPQQEQEKEQEPEAPRKRGNAVTRFFEGEVERLTEETEGSWMLFEYADPLQLVADGSATGFATFHDGFLTLILAIDALEPGFLKVTERILLQSGAYRYRFDESGFLQLAGVVGFTNQTAKGDVQHEPADRAYEYFARLDDGVLELRNADGVRLSFRKVMAGDFPESASRKLDGRRSATDHWEVDSNEER